LIRLRSELILLPCPACLSLPLSLCFSLSVSVSPFSSPPRSLTSRRLFQLVIIASHTDTHPPTDLHVTDDGWAYITTTSNFDVYLHDHLHHAPNDNDSHPLPLVTLSATLHEAIVIADKPSLPPPGITISSSSSSLAKSWSDLPLPFYRKMSVVCFDPANPSSSFHGGWTAPIAPQDIDNFNWDRETTSTDGIVCISSSMSGAVQLCIPSRATPITPSPSVRPPGAATTADWRQSQEQLGSNGFVTSQTAQTMVALPTLTFPRELDNRSDSTLSRCDSLEFSTGPHPPPPLSSKPTAPVRSISSPASLHRQIHLSALVNTE
jgi:hypothetical protein